MNRKKIRTRVFAVMAAVTVMLPANLQPVAAAQTNLPDSGDLVYSWDFENGSDVGNAVLEGGAAVVADEVKGNVLSLPGEAPGAGSMKLPEDLFQKLAEDGNNGFTISMWVKADASTGAYTKFFNASNSVLGATYDGSNNWSLPDFALAAGGDVYDMTMYVGAAGSTVNADKSKLKYNVHLARDNWEHVTVTLTPDDYKVYINGKEIAYQDAQDNTAAIRQVLPKLFGAGYLETLKYASVGKSLYTSDNDFKGAVDDICFYKRALDESQVKALFESYGTVIPKPSLTVDMTHSIGAVKHGATGFLYGQGEEGVPNVNLLTAIKPYVSEQKPPEGLQHPNGDVLSIAETFFEAGGDSIQVACPDIYSEWPYEFESIPEYIEKLKVQVQQIRDAGYSEKVVYVPFNEPNGNWYGGMWGDTQQRFFDDWKTVYDAIKSVDPNAKIAGSNLTHYIDYHVQDFVRFCAANDCIPDQFTWHVLNDGAFNSFSSDLAKYRSYEKQYWIDPGLVSEEREVVINEYADFTHLGVPGQLARWIGLFEDEKVTACLAYWHISNNLDDLAADNNEPNGAWWLYKWYGDMSGETLKITPKRYAKDKLYGVASLDEKKKSANVLFGGVDGDIDVKLTNLDDTQSFANGKVNVKLESTSWTGINGAAIEPYFVKEEICEVNPDGTVTVLIEDMVAAEAYNLTITPAAENAETGTKRQGAWRRTYEGENAVLAGNARAAGKNSKYACSGDGQAHNINYPGDSATFHVDVPADGFYKFEMVYGAATGNDTGNPNANNPRNAIQRLYVDGKRQADMILENTLHFYMSGMHTEYVYLTQGQHALKVEATNSVGKATIDCVYLTFTGSDEEALKLARDVKTYEAELADFNVLGGQTASTVTTRTMAAGYSGSGYVTDVNTPVEDGGGIRFITNVERNGMYDVELKYQSDTAENVRFYLDNTVKTLNNLLVTKPLVDTGGIWENVRTRMFLQKGINIIDLYVSSAAVALDQLTIVWSEDQGQVAVIEAEDCEVQGDVRVGQNQFASGGKYIEEILSSSTGEHALFVKYNALETGEYKMVVYQSNKELFGRHDYNAQMVDRFITLSVNDGQPYNAFFRNTYSEDAFKSQVVKLNLKKGDNVIKIYNDDSRTLKNGVGGVNKCINYTPNLDKFEITAPLYQEPVFKVDTSVLEELIKAADIYQESDYTKESYAAYKQVYDKANQLLQSKPDESKQAEVDQTVMELLRAISGLTKSSPTEEVSKKAADISRLLAAADSAGKMDRKLYTNESLIAFDNALKLAENLISAKPGTGMQQVVDAALASLNSAVANLKKVVVYPKVGMTVTSGNFLYKITASTASQKTVLLSKPVKKNLTSATIPATIKIQGHIYKVTSISDKAFYKNKKLSKVTIGKNVISIGKNVFNGCVKLKSITVKSSNVKKVGKGTFKNTHKKAVIKVPKKQLKKYRRIFGNKGQAKNVKIK